MLYCFVYKILVFKSLLTVTSVCLNSFWEHSKLITTQKFVLMIHCDFKSIPIIIGPKRQKQSCQIQFYIRIKICTLVNAIYSRNLLHQKTINLQLKIWSLHYDIFSYPSYCVIRIKHSLLIAYETADGTCLVMYWIIYSMYCLNNCEIRD